MWTTVSFPRLILLSRLPLHPYHTPSLRSGKCSSASKKAGQRKVEEIGITEKTAEAVGLKTPATPPPPNRLHHLLENDIKYVVFCVC